MRITRRQFVSWGLAAGAAIGVEGVGHAFFGHVMRTATRRDEPVPSVCRACPAGCGIVGYLRDKTQLTAILGNPEHPASRGKVCALALAAINLHYHPERLWQARRRNGQTLETTAALDEAQRQLAGLLAEGATVVIDTWDEQAAHADFLAPLGVRGKLIGREALAGANRQAVMREIWGAEVRPDIEAADLLLVFDDRPLDEGPRFIQDARRIVEGQVDRGLKVVVFDPHLANTGGKADLWVPIRPGTARVAALALVRHTLEHWKLDATIRMGGQYLPLYFLAEALDAYDFEYAAHRCGVDPELLRQAADLLLESHRPATMAGDGVFDGADAKAAYASIALIDLLFGERQIPVIPRPRWVPEAQALTAVEAEEFYRELEFGEKRRKIILITHRANPVYERGGRLESALVDGAAAYHLAISPLPNETAGVADLVIPEALPLECEGRVWLTAYVPTPTYALQQPIAPPPKGVLPAKAVFAALTGAEPPANAAAENDLRWVRDRLGVQAFFEIAQGIFAGDVNFKPELVYTPSLAYFKQLAPLETTPAHGGRLELLLHGGPTTNRTSAQAKWLAEIDHAAKLFVNPDDARRLRVRTGDAVRLLAEESRPAPARPVEVKVEVFVSGGIRPGCAALNIGQGHPASGLLALASRFSARLDPDMKLIWWEDQRNGVNLSPLTTADPAPEGDRLLRPLVRLRVRRA
ncbi:MAG: molybdopterin-dependent oxidoreductase [Myxococcales bacterium]|nr:molybdopterin-dependent oxidoreductase [Myxococcales bacterium]